MNTWEQRNNEAIAQWNVAIREIAHQYSAQKRALAARPLRDRISPQGYAEAARIETENAAAVDAIRVAYYAATIS